MLLHEYLIRSSAESPEKTALITGHARQTYAELCENACRISSFLQANGLAKGDRVLLHLDNCPEAVSCIFGVLMAGGCFVIVHPATPAERLAHIIRNCEPKFVIAGTGRSDTIAAIERNTGVVFGKVFVAASGEPSEGKTFHDVLAHKRLEPRPDLVDMDLAAIIYTSGSTGKPKGVTLTHRNIDVVAESVADYLGNNGNDMILCFLQLAFSYGLLQLLVTVRTGATLILEKGYSYPYELVRLVREYGVTGFAGAPTVFSILLQMGGVGGEDFSSLRYITNAAAAMPATYIPRLRKMFPRTKIFLMHGQTECLRTTYLPPEEVESRPTSVGRGMRNVELWLEDADGKRLGPGQVGEMVVRGANVMQGYWNDPEASSKVLLPGPYPWEKVLHTGDLFRLDENSYFHFVSRTDDIIKSRGEKVSPLEVENVLYGLEAVKECRVLGVADPISGEAVKAEIVLKEGSVLSESDVRAHCAVRLESFKVPHSIVFVEQLPRTLSGKIHRR